MSAGHWIMLAAGLLAVLANFALLRSRDDMVQVAAADRDFGRGSTATSDAFHLVEIQGDTEVLSSLVPADRVAALDGLIAARSITASELISTSDFVSAAAPSEERAMSIPVDRVHAAGGMISDAELEQHMSAYVRCGPRVESGPLAVNCRIGDLCFVGQESLVRKTVLQMWVEANERAETITPAELAEELESGDVLLLDVRLPTEIERRGRIEGSVPVPRQVVEWWADPESPYFRPDGVFGDFDQRIVTVCDGGGNGTFTAVTLQELGYRNVVTLEGGFYGWVGAGHPVVETTDRGRP